jgi:hypothetical protein
MKASERIPKHLRAEVKKQVMFIKQNPHAPKRHINWLIEVYNKCFCPNPLKKEGCRTDRNNVLNSLYACVLTWKKEQQKKEEG